jgi:putative transcriptional regulator
MSRVGQLLIAHPNLPKNNPWHKRVIYVFSDDHKTGTQGIIINHPTKYSVTNFITGKGFHDMPLSPESMRIGGPVNPKVIFMLHTDEWYSSSTHQVSNQLAISCDDFMLHKMSVQDQPSLWRMFAGMCSWAPGQLDMELRGQPPYRPENSWLTATANYNIIFEYDGERQWDKCFALASKQTIDSWF